MSRSRMSIRFCPSRRRLLTVGLLMPVALGACQRRAPAAPIQYVDLRVETDVDLLAFKPTELSCPTGAHVRLTLHHTGKYASFEHN